MEMTIRNLEEVQNTLAIILMDFAKQQNSYHTDVYLYYDEENQTATLDTFVNVGGNSWLADNHYTLYTDYPHYEGGWADEWQCMEQFCECLGKTEAELTAEAAAYYDESDVDWIDFIKYIQSVPEYAEKCTAIYNEMIDEDEPYYFDAATEILSEFLTND